MQTSCCSLFCFSTFMKQQSSPRHVLQCFGPRSRTWLLVLSLLLTVALAWPRCLVAQQAPVVSALDQSQFPCSPMAVPRITAAVNDRMLTSLNGNVHPLARAEYDQGKVDDSLPLKHIILMLQRSPEQEKALATRIDQMHNRRSPYYHRWLKAEDVGGCYGVADPDIAKVTGWLQSHGFQIDEVPAGKTLVIFSGTAGQVRSTFKTEIHNLNVRGERHIANVSEPQVPTALAPVITGFRSLNNFFPKPLVHVLGPVQRDSATGKWHALAANKRVAGSGPRAKSNGISPLLTFTGDDETFWAVGPQDFYTIYNETPLLTASRPINGAGQTVAIVQDSDVNPADVTSFRSQFGLPTYPAMPNNTQGGVNFINGISGYCEDPGIVNGGETEADVDVQWLGTSAPAAIIDLVSCADTATTFGGDLSASYIVSTLDTTVSAFSESFGECEAQLPGSGVGSNGFYNGLWEQAVAEGQTPIISAGDSGDDVCDRGNGEGPNGGDLGETGLSVNGLASTPYNVAAGGTDFSDSYQTNFSPTNYWNNNDSSPYGSALSYVPEMAWNDTCASTVLVDYVSYVENITYGNGPEGLCNDVNNFGEEFTTLDGGSGGISSIYSRPSWQSVYGVGLNGNFTSTSNRNLPDVSLFAADGFWGHFLVFCQSDVAPCDYSNSTDALSMAAGGTSFVAPQLGGIMGLINQATASRQGQANYTLYALAAQEYGTPNAPNNSAGAPSLYTCEGSNVNAISAYSGIFPRCTFYNINRTSQFGFTSCVGGNNNGCLVDNNDQPCATGTPDCYTNTSGDAYGLLSNSTSTFENAFPQSAGYSAATGLGSINVANLVTSWSSGGSPVTTATLSGTLQGGVYVSPVEVTLTATDYPSGVAATYYEVDGGSQQTYYGPFTVSASGSHTVGFHSVSEAGIVEATKYVSFTISASNFSLTVSFSGNGTVTSTDGNISCPGTCSYVYPANAQVTLNASATQGWTFVGWTGACSGTGSCAVTMTQSFSGNAIFAGSGALQFIATTPCRLVDTRGAEGEFGGPPIQGGTARSFPIPQNQNCNIPANAAAYSLNVTVVPHGFLGYLTVWPTGQNQPVVSTLNSYDGRTKANAAIVPAGSGEAVSVYASNTTNLILDIDGYFAPVSASTVAFYPLPPCRVADTRGTPGELGGPYLTGGATRDFPILEAAACNIPASALAYSLNFTAIPHGPLGYLTVWPTNQQQPVVSTLNAPTGTVTANAAIVPAGMGGEVSTFAYNDTDLLIDIDGYFAVVGQGGLSLYPLPPCRVLDTRPNDFNGTLSPPVDVLSSPCPVPSQAQAYVFNATVVPVGSLGYLTLWPDGISQPVVSTLNASDGAVTSNMAIVPAGNQGKVDAFAQGTTNLLLDISSYVAP